MWDPEFAENLQKRRSRMLFSILPHVAFDGWTTTALERGSLDAGYDRDEVFLLFPEGVSEVLAYWSEVADQEMMERGTKEQLDARPIRERIEILVKIRLALLAPHKEAVRRALTHAFFPSRTTLASSALYQTVNAMWTMAGDRSADFNFYTKRCTLSLVYTSTFLCWLGDSSEDYQDTWAFLKRRIHEVMMFQKGRQKLKDTVDAASFTRFRTKN